MNTQLSYCKVLDKELLDYLVSTWKYRDIVIHSVDMNKKEKKLSGNNYF